MIELGVWGEFWGFSEEESANVYQDTISVSIQAAAVKDIVTDLYAMANLSVSVPKPGTLVGQEKLALDLEITDKIIRIVLGKKSEQAREEQDQAAKYIQQ